MTCADRNFGLSENCTSNLGIKRSNNDLHGYFFHFQTGGEDSVEADEATRVVSLTFLRVVARKNESVTTHCADLYPDIGFKLSHQPCL